MAAGSRFFIREIVPRQLIAKVARICYNEPYSAMPMRHRVETESSGLVEYAWRHKGRWNALQASILGEPRLPAENSEEQFITEHYWGYTGQRNGDCTEYNVDHSRWNVWKATDASLECDAADLYGAKFAEPLGAPPESAFVAEGSPVVVSACGAL